MTFVIDEKNLGPYSLNKYYAGMNIHQRRKHTQYWHELTHYALRQAGIRRNPKDGPWVVRYYFDSRLDVDNHAVIAKMVTDAMKGWVYPNDTRRYLRGSCLYFWEGKGIRVDVVPWEGNP